MESWVERFSKFPTANKVLVLILVSSVMTAANYFWIVMPMTEELTAFEKSEVSLNQELQEKREYAQNLEKNKREMEIKEQQWADALTQLPDRQAMDELIKQFEDIAKKSGLVFSLKNLDEDTKDSFARMPAQMSVTGSYSEIAMFLQEVSNLRRIVNVTNIKLTEFKASGEKNSLRGEFLVTTFRFIEKSEKKVGRK